MTKDLLLTVYHIALSLAPGEPLDPVLAKQGIRRLLAEGTGGCSAHALEALTQDDLTTVGGVTVLRGGGVEPPAWERGSWRYRVRTTRLYVVGVVRSANELPGVPAWRDRA